MNDVAFDAVALDYDREFTRTPLARLLRAQVWARLAAHFGAGDRVLELNCGTGEDAVWLARRGVRVTATDSSPVMLRVAERKVRECGLGEWVETQILDLAAPRPTPDERVRFDGVLSNFGGLNCVPDLRPLAAFLAGRMKPCGAVIFVPMNRWCAWEIVWHLLHRQPRTAFRRLRHGGVEARVGNDTLRVWYPSIKTLRQMLAPHFQLRRVIGLGVCLPPSYLEPVITERPRLLRWLQRFDRLTRNHWPFNRLADHVILEFERLT